MNNDQNQNPYSDQDMPLENITIEQSGVIEDALLQIGDILASAFLKTTRYDEAMIIDEMTGAFSYAAESYGEQTNNRIRSDLGVSLAESSLMKVEAFRENDLITPQDNEWLHFAKDAQQTITSEKQRLSK
ncbi:MAG: hypothetical protein L0H36_02545 [bacterium]|nr:hypothetical protein [bacterium]